MKFELITDTAKLKKGDVIRRQIGVNEFEYNVLGNYYPNIPGWEFYPDGHNYFVSDNALLYMKSEDIIKNKYELRID